MKILSMKPGSRYATMLQLHSWIALNDLATGAGTDWFILLGIKKNRP
jgi:hypothetical protein